VAPSRVRMHSPQSDPSGQKISGAESGDTLVIFSWFRPAARPASARTQRSARRETRGARAVRRHRRCCRVNRAAALRPCDRRAAHAPGSAMAIRRSGCDCRDRKVASKPMRTPRVADIRPEGADGDNPPARPGRARPAVDSRVVSTTICRRFAGLPPIAWRSPAPSPADPDEEQVEQVHKPIRASTARPPGRAGGPDGQPRVPPERCDERAEARIGDHPALRAVLLDNGIVRIHSTAPPSVDPAARSSANFRVRCEGVTLREQVEDPRPRREQTEVARGNADDRSSTLSPAGPVHSACQALKCRRQ
jgi:hypothetical protein